MKNVSSVKNTWTLCSFSPSVAENQDTFLFPSYLDYDFKFFPKFLRRRKGIHQHQPSVALNYTVCVMKSTFFLKTFLTSSDCYQLLFRSVPSCYTRICFIALQVITMVSSVQYFHHFLIIYCLAGIYATVIVLFWKGYVGSKFPESLHV